MQASFDPETQAALDALMKGGPAEEEVTETPDVDSVEIDGDSLDTSEVNTDLDIVEVPEALDAKAIEEIWVDDGSGRKKVQIDYSDKESIKKYAEMAYGMRKFQRERDQVNQWKKENEPKLQELKEAWDAVEKAHKTHGVKGLVNLLVGEENAYEKHIEAVFQSRQMRENASPEELAKLDAIEEAASIRKENELFKAELKKQQEQRQMDVEQAATKALQDKLTPAYTKWSFEGKLGNAELEEQYNTALWQLGINKLKAIPEDQELTQAAVNKVFQDIAAGFNKVVATQTKQKVAETIQKKRDAAQNKAAVMATKSVPSSAAADEFRGHIKSGNFVDSLKMFMTGQVKLK